MLLHACSHWDRNPTASSTEFQHLTLLKPERWNTNNNTRLVDAGLEFVMKCQFFFNYCNNLHFYIIVHIWAPPMQIPYPRKFYAKQDGAHKPHLCSFPLLKHYDFCIFLHFPGDPSKKITPTLSFFQIRRNKGKIQQPNSTAQ